MSDHIPFEIQEEILKKLPVKSVVRFQSVSKEWRSLINSSKFIKVHHTQSQLHHLLVDTGKKYISVTDNDKFPNHKFSVTVPNDLRSASIVGSSHGIVCFRGCYHDSGKRTEQVVLWNPTVKKSVRIYIPHRLYHRQSIVVGFGVSPETNDPKLIKICVAKPPRVCWEVEVFTLSSRVWRSVSNFRESRKLWRDNQQVSVDGFIYFHSIDVIIKLGDWSNFIVSFDLKSEEFREVCLPDRLVHSRNMRVSKVNESFSVLEYYHDVCDVWAMKDDGVSEYFTKIFTVKVPSNSVRSEVLWFRKNGEVLINMVDNKDKIEVMIKDKNQTT
ncbi:putative F-box domain-containing protein [Tanacetum coccineum]